MELRIMDQTGCTTENTKSSVFFTEGWQHCLGPGIPPLAFPQPSSRHPVPGLLPLPPQALLPSPRSRFSFPCLPHPSSRPPGPGTPPPTSPTPPLSPQLPGLLPRPPPPVLPASSSPDSSPYHHYQFTHKYK